MMRCMLCLDIFEGRELSIKLKCIYQWTHQANFVREICEARVSEQRGVTCQVREKVQMTTSVARSLRHIFARVSIPFSYFSLSTALLLTHELVTDIGLRRVEWVAVVTNVLRRKKHLRTSTRFILQTRFCRCTKSLASCLDKDVIHTQKWVKVAMIQRRNGTAYEITPHALTLRQP